MIKLVIIADDLTGALDSCVHCAGRGIQSAVVWGADIKLDRYSPYVGVVAVNTASRHMAPEKAAFVVRQITREAVKLRIPYIYKKTDSTLRGNIGAELEAVYRETDVDLLPFIPAYPEVGRTSLYGILYVDGIPVHQTAAGRDPFTPVLDSAIEKVIRIQTALPVELSSTEDTRQKRGICIMDATDQAGLYRIGDVLRQKGKIRVTAGSGGFAQVLADQIDFDGQEIDFESQEGGILFICGSVNPKTISQIHYARRIGVPVLRIPEELLYKEKLEKRDALPFMIELEGIVRDNESVLLCSSDGWENSMEPGLRKKVEQNMGYLTKWIWEEIAFQVLSVFGGDTLLSIMEALDVYDLMPYGEIQPGIVKSRFVWEEMNYTVVSKSGNFGGERVVPDIIEHFRPVKERCTQDDMQTGS